MSTWKAASTQASRPAQVRPTVAATTERPPAPRVDVVSLAIDTDEDPGSDPYNRTGQFCKPEIDERAD